MPGQGPVSARMDCCFSAEPPSVARTEGGDSGRFLLLFPGCGRQLVAEVTAEGSTSSSLSSVVPELFLSGSAHMRSAGHSYYQNSKGADGIKDGHKMNSHIVKLLELWKTPQMQTIHIPKSITDVSFLKPPDLTLCQKRYLCGIAESCHVNCLRVLMKRQYVRMIQRSCRKPGVLTHHGSCLGSRHSQRQHYSCTAWRHQLDREDSGPSSTAAAPARQHSLWRPVRNKGGLKTGHMSKARYRSLKIFRKTGRLFMQSVFTKNFESYVNEEKKEDLLSKCMQSMSIEEQGEHLTLT